MDFPYLFQTMVLAFLQKSYRKFIQNNIICKVRLVRQIVEAQGRIKIENNVPSGLKVTMIFEK